MKGLVLTLAMAALQCGGCSFQLSMPPSEPEKRTQRAARECGGTERAPVVYPLFDTLSVIAGATWVLHAETPENSGSQRELEKIFGYSVIGLFGTAALYGYVVTGRCASLRGEVEARRPSSPDTVARRPFPYHVFRFRFGMREDETQRECASMGRTWESDGAAACKAGAPTLAQPDIELGFELGALSRVKLSYGPSEQLGRDYDTVYRTLRREYGPPQVERSALSVACRASLSECLAAGEHPAGATWSWQTGSIELNPVWRDDQALVELVYTWQPPLVQ